MKKIFKIITFVFIFMVISTTNVNAVVTDESLEEMEHNLENYHFNFKIADMTENYEMIRNEKDDIVWIDLENTFLNLLVRREVEKIVHLDEDGGMEIFCHFKGDIYTISEQDQEGQWHVVEKTAESDVCEVSVYADVYNDGVSFSKEITGVIEVVNGNDEYRKEALSIAKSIQKNFYVTDLDIVNHIFNYKTTTPSFFEGNNVTLEFVDIKNVIEENPNYDYFVSLEEVRRGDYFVGLEEGGTFIERDGIIYAFAYHTYGAGSLYFVPVGTKVEDYKTVLENRIKDYIKDDTVVVEIEKTNFEWFDGENNHESSYVNAGGTVLSILGLTYDEYLEKYNTSLEIEQTKLTGSDDLEYCNYENECIAVGVYKLKIDDDEYEIGIIEVEDEMLNRVGITTSVNKDTGIMIKTNAGNVPLDASLNIKDYQITEKEVEILKSIGYKNLKGYDLTLFSKILNKTISNFTADSEILIPANEKNENLKVFYIKEDGSVENYDVQYVTIDEKLYMSFKTSHFSNYLVAEELNYSNPLTNDDIMLWKILGVISLTCLFATVVCLKKSNKKLN